MRYNKTKSERTMAKQGAGLILATGLLVPLATPVQADHRDGYRDGYRDGHRGKVERRVERRQDRQVERKIDRRIERKIARKIARKLDRKIHHRDHVYVAPPVRHHRRHDRGRFVHVPNHRNYAWVAVHARPNRVEPMPYHRWQRFMTKQGYAPRALKPKRYRKYVRAFYRAQEQRRAQYAYRW